MIKKNLNGGIILAKIVNVRITKIYEFEINNKLVEVKKTWFYTDIDNIIDCDWEIISVKKKSDYTFCAGDELLSEDEKEETKNLVNELKGEDIIDELNFNELNC